MKKLAFILLAFAFALAGHTPTAAAEEAGLTEKLQQTVAALNVEQQAALLLVLTEMSTAPAVADAPKAETPKEALFESLKAFETASASGNFDPAPFFARLSEDFEHPVVRDKAGAIAWVEGMAPALFDDGKSMVTFSLDDVEVDVEGDEAYAYPVDIETPIGSATVEISARLEDDGKWRVIAIDGL